MKEPTCGRMDVRETFVSYANTMDHVESASGVKVEIGGTKPPFGFAAHPSVTPRESADDIWKVKSEG